MNLKKIKIKIKRREIYERKSFLLFQEAWKNLEE